MLHAGQFTSLCHFTIVFDPAHRLRYSEGEMIIIDNIQIKKIELTANKINAQATGRSATLVES